MNSNLKVTQFLQHIFKPAYQKLLSSCLLLLSPPSSQPEGCGLWITKIQEKIEKEETKSSFLVWLKQRNLDESHLWTSSPPFFETTGQGAGWGAWIDLIWLTLLFLVIIQFTSFSVFDQTIKDANGTIKLRVGFGFYISSHLNKASSQLLFTHKLAKIQHQSLDQTLVLISPPKFSPKSSPKFSFKSSTILHPSLELANIGQLELELSSYLHQPHQSSLLTELVTWGQGQAIQSEEEATCTLARGNCSQPGLEKICWSVFKMICGNIHHFPPCLVLAQQSQPRSPGPCFKTTIIIIIMIIITITNII